MRICFTSDLHGSPELFDQLERLVSSERPALLILGGDMLLDGDPHDPVASQCRYVREQFIPRVRQLRARVDGLRVACIMGNHDWIPAEVEIARHHREGSIVLLSTEQPWYFGGLNFLGYSHTPPTPWWVKDYERLDLPTDALPQQGGSAWNVSEQRVWSRSAQEHYRAHPAMASDLATAAAVRGRWIFVSHTPPRDTALDLLPHVDRPVGSRAVRAFIEHRQPQVALHGHIHESPAISGAYVDSLGATLCVNPGQGLSRLHAVLFDSDDPAASRRHTVFD
ncbi:MAG: hypothetical protein CHACPFDD_03012 [Phycisphaerae bacterium]|nr:hypothetical protein [Phycisphaerae bacterium]